jgi:uncharacterized protein HemY
LNLIQRIAGIAIGLVLFVLAFIFASVILAAAGGIALGVWAWLAWKTRKMRREMAKGDSSVIEGEYRVEREVRRIDDDVR